MERIASQYASQSHLRPRKLRFTILQCDLAGSSNSSFLEKLQDTRLKNVLRQETSSSVLNLHKHTPNVFLHLLWPSGSSIKERPISMFLNYSMHTSLSCKHTAFWKPCVGLSGLNLKACNQPLLGI